MNEDDQFVTNKTSHPYDTSGTCHRLWCVSHGWTQTEPLDDTVYHSLSLELSRCLFLNLSRRRFQATPRISSLSPLRPLDEKLPGRTRLLAVPSLANRRARLSEPIALGLPLPQSSLYWSHNEPDCSCGIKKFVLRLNYPPPTFSLYFLPLSAPSWSSSYASATFRTESNHPPQCA